MPLPNIGSMDGNTGRSEGATAEKAVPFPCAVLDPNRSFVELRVREPLQGLVAFRIFVRTPIRPNSAWKAFASSPHRRLFGTARLVKPDSGGSGRFGSTRQPYPRLRRKKSTLCEFYERLAEHAKLRARRQS